MALIPMNTVEIDAAIATGEAVMLYFWTDWHEICKESVKILEEVAATYEGKAIIASVNADAEGARAMELGVYSIPTVILFQAGEEVERIAGIQPASLYNSLLEFSLHPEEINPYDLINSMGYS